MVTLARGLNMAQATWQCTRCGKPPHVQQSNDVNAKHAQYPAWLKKGIKQFCWRCMCNTKQVVVQGD